MRLQQDAACLLAHCHKKHNLFEEKYGDNVSRNGLTNQSIRSFFKANFLSNGYGL